jgi:hypothetical protein
LRTTFSSYQIKGGFQEFAQSTVGMAVIATPVSILVLCFFQKCFKFFCCTAPRKKTKDQKKDRRKMKGKLGKSPPKARKKFKDSFQKVDDFVDKVRSIPAISKFRKAAGIFHKFSC